MELDESHEYFLLKIPEGVRNKVLVLITHQDSDSDLSKDDDTLFSDPDFYISKIHKYPSSRLSSEWYSQRYGADIITIPSGSVKEGDIFYIGMYCQFKCRYYLNSYVTFEITIHPGIGYVINIKPNETGNLKLPIHYDFDELKVIVHYRQRGKIRVFMSNEMPTTQNSFNVVPSWIYGYSISVRKNTKEYCSKCDYHIFIKNEGKNTIYNLLVMPIIQKDRFPLRTNLPLYEAMDKNSKRCYTFPVNQNEKEKEKLILQITMHSGKIDILFEGWEPKKDSEIKSSDKLENIMDEQFFLFDKKQFDIYDKESESFEGKNSNFHFCVYSKLESSFVISAYFLTKMEHFQQFRDINILLPGNSMKGYLLKDQVFKYDLFGFNLDKAQYDLETNITVKLKNIRGKAQLYGYYCEKENCIFKKSELDSLLEEKTLIEPIEENTFSGSYLKINNKNNFCLKYQNQLVPLDNNNDNIKDCMIIILVHCNEISNEGLCIYDIQLEISDEPILMKPRQMYYGVIPIKKSDKYEIVITDEKIYNLVIVLNTESGDAELKLLKERPNAPTIGWLSFNNDYIPEVIRITPSKIHADNLLGKFIINVYSKTFSTYHLYYYTTYKKENNTEATSVSNIFNSEITMNLKIGEIVSDYFPIDIRYKIFSFIIMDKKENIKIFMNKVNIGFNLYVFKTISDFKIAQIYEIAGDRNRDSITGYTWKSNANNEINININDPEYSLNHYYYIIIEPTFQINYTKIIEEQNIRDKDDPREFNFIETVARNAAIKFYLGVSTENTPLMISEGMPHTLTLSKNYNGQLYYYMHFDTSKDFNLGINVLFGEIDIYIDINQIDINEIDSLKDEDNYDSNLGHYQVKSLEYYKNIKTYYELYLSSNYFKKYLPEEEKVAKIYFYIKRSNSYISIDSFKESQYTIIQKSSYNKEEVLIPGETRTSVIPLGKRQHFIIEELTKRKSGNINVFFKNGYGNVYVRIPKVPEVENIRFPNEGSYDYIGETIYSGKNILIPSEVYERLNSHNTKLQILITVVAETGPIHTNSTSEVIFSINYSNEPKRINQNEPYDGYIRKGELQYYTFYFDSKTENIYIGLSNMKGDADMYLNYGEALPTTKKFNWNSHQINHEFIDINIKDKFFQKKEITSLKGFYTLLIVGYTETQFTLFISKHKNIIFPLRNNKKSTCICEDEGDKCWFRYTDVFMQQNKENGINYNEIIFTSNYLYGNGIMYTKVVKDEEFHKIKNLSKIFPDKDNYDISNKESKQRNYVKIQIKEEKYTEDSNILMSFICSEKTKVDITSTSIRYFKTTDFIEENKENYYYLGFNPNSEELQSDLTLFFYNYDKKKRFNI